MSSLFPIIMVAALSLVCAQVGPAGASNHRVAYVDAIDIYGQTSPDSAAGYLERALTSAGFAVQVADPGLPSCGAAGPACLIQRAASVTAEIAVSATVLDLAGHVSLDVLVVRTRDGESWRHMVRNVDLDSDVSELASALAAGAGMSARATPSSARRIWAWSLGTSALALAAAGGFVLYRAHAQERDFLAHHTDANGDLIGISLQEARRAEDRARRWQLAGIVLLAGAGAAGITATILFATGEDEQPRPAGLAVEGRF